MERLLIIIKTDIILLIQLLTFSIKSLIFRLRGIKTIVYNMHHDYFYDIFESVYLKLLQDPNLKIYFSCSRKDRKLMTYLEQKCSKKSIISNLISPFFPFDLYICAEITGPDFPISYLKTKKIQIYHGTGVHNLYEKKDVLNRFDIHFAIGPQYLKFIEHAYKNKKLKPKIYEVGYPKLDVLTHSEPFSTELKKMYNLNQRPVILYAPHWNEFSSVHKFQETILSGLARLDADILVKPHNYLFVKNSDWKERLRQISDKYENLKIVSRPNTQELYPISDIMITDTGTTAGLEYSVLQKPLLIYCRQDWFEIIQDVTVERDICEAAICFDSVEDLLEIIGKILSKQTEMTKLLEFKKRKQNDLIQNYLFNLGTATDVSYNAILSEIGLS